LVHSVCQWPAAFVISLSPWLLEPTHRSMTAVNRRCCAKHKTDHLTVHNLQQFTVGTHAGYEYLPINNLQGWQPCVGLSTSAVNSVPAPGLTTVPAPAPTPAPASAASAAFAADATAGKESSDSEDDSTEDKKRKAESLKTGNKRKVVLRLKVQEPQAKSKKKSKQNDLLLLGTR